MMSGHILGSPVTSVLRTVRISNVQCALCIDRDGSCRSWNKQIN